MVVTVFIYGGSNSLLKTGWTAGLQEDFPPHSVVNHSIGATTSVTAIYQMLTNAKIRHEPGDVVVWEYALNEANHITKGLDPEIALGNTERFIRECARRELKLAAAVFTPLDQEMAEERMPYYSMLHALFQHYGIEIFDVSQTWRLQNDVPRVPRRLYRNKAHYADDPEIRNFIIAGVKTALGKAQRPMNVSPLRCGPGELHVELAKTGERFENSRISALVAPINYRMEFSRKGAVVGLAALVHPNSRSGLHVRLDRRNRVESMANFSTAGAKSMGKPIMKVYSAEAAKNVTWDVIPGDVLDIGPLNSAGLLYSETSSRGELKRLDEVQPASFIGVVMELSETD
ncbi:SGNH/GDSL hydrolase family protein [Tabrizicola oligotrophica]|uniref:SGNH/GDSL hydrolase family protein n=1 Tax=Tabrizicola oligotrophica TaxID=2710650 RepID=A0A6M0QP71_9RHOB|nr:SGNH/GDSL hydrolase family protein [Tabrizicola oligotrophica]NEY89217.1 SGNH/GDSL hydrolase family protein [Tabrizicola oligotrophica]